MKINDLLMCIVKDLNSFGFENVTCIPQQDGTVAIKSIVKDKSIWVTAVSKDKVDGLTMPFVMSQLSMLSSMMNYEPYRMATITEGNHIMCDDPYSGNKVQTNAAFNFVNGATRAHIRLAPLNIGAKVPDTLKPKSCIEITPDAASAKGLATTASIFSSVDTHVRPIVDSGKLIFEFGAENSSNHCARQPFADTTEADMTIQYTFPVRMINAALSINDAFNTMQIIPTGVIIILAETDSFSFKFVIPGRS